ncbi:MAG: alkane 1-monooxygenase [Pseudomonadota bacterium]
MTTGNLDAALTRAGSDQSKRYLWTLSLLVAGAPAVASATLLATGWTWIALTPLLFYYVVVPVLDMAVGEDPYNPDEADLERLAADRWFTGLLVAAVAVYYVSFLTSAYAAATADLPFLIFVALALGAGAASGSALAVGHELGHRTNRFGKIAALFANGLSGYAHFRIEHNQGHHVAVATPEDSASARLGESVWRFACREIPGGVARAWKLESRRLRARGGRVWSLENEILQGWAFSAVIAGLLIAWLGPIAIAFLMLHQVSAWLQLTFANYVEHYGLLRARRENGRYEPCQPKHSWNSNHIVSNLMLFHLQRHSDHHANPMAHYQTLRNFPGLPSLPNGYPGCFVLAAVPPLWFKVMDEKALAWADGDPARLNVAPHAAKRYAARAV